MGGCKQSEKGVACAGVGSERGETAGRVTPMASTLMASTLMASLTCTTRKDGSPCYCDTVYQMSTPPPKTSEASSQPAYPSPPWHTRPITFTSRGTLVPTNVTDPWLVMTLPHFCPSSSFSSRGCIPWPAPYHTGNLAILSPETRLQQPHDLVGHHWP
jgi:hypothetical protein